MSPVLSYFCYYYSNTIRYFGYAADRLAQNKSGIEDVLQGLICFTLTALLLIFALILGAHRSAFGNDSGVLVDTDASATSEYDPPIVMK